MKDLQQLENSYYVMRHGESLANIEKKIVSSPQNGLSGYGLTAKGKEQAAAAINNFPNLGRDTVVVSSDSFDIFQKVAPQSPQGAGQPSCG